MIRSVKTSISAIAALVCLLTVGVFAQQRIGVRIVGVEAVTGILNSSSWSYDGFFLVPTSDSPISPPFSFSAGVLSGRRYTDIHGTDTLRLFLSGNNSRQDIYELTDPGVGTSKVNGVSGALTSTIYRRWIDVFQGRSNCTFVYDGCTGSGYPVFSGMGYVGNTYGNGQQMLVTFRSNYQIAAGDPSLLSCTLNDDETIGGCYGPWFAAYTAQGFSGSIGLIPDAAWIAAAGSGKSYIHTPVEGNQSGATRGANILTFDPPANGTPADVPINTYPGSPTINPGVAIFYDANHPQARNTNTVFETVDPRNGYAACSAQPTWTAGLPFFNQGPGSNPNYIGLDWTNAAVWVKTANQRGVMFIAQQTEDIAGMDYSGAPGLRFTGPGHSSSIYGAAFSFVALASTDTAAKTVTAPGVDWDVMGFHVGNQLHVVHENVIDYGVFTIASISGDTITLTTGVPDTLTSQIMRFPNEPAQNCVGTTYIPFDAATGPQSTSLARRMYFFDPTPMITIANGGATPYSLAADSDVVASQFATDWGTGLGHFLSPPDLMINIRDIGGMYFDQPSSKLYISQAYAIGSLTPVIHRFSLISPAPEPIPQLAQLDVLGPLKAPWKYKVDRTPKPVAFPWVLVAGLGLVAITRRS